MVFGDGIMWICASWKQGFFDKLSNALCFLRSLLVNKTKYIVMNQVRELLESLEVN
jgi:hypothetical protein